ncbi:lysozyme [Parasteatoda tepidariorum]|uniref:lysozyme n=1 Tax=Parasteatoda tepidariorum TaxID=114398 RepID=UPI00077F92EE|nr:invertebrate-type lysozyme 6 isoform X1 [Parasteatoda tepidariorum]XP_042901858.1 invertebrate-type lysozyme 6 isoform X2 [Parasteatoda tepidariorum]
MSLQTIVTVALIVTICISLLHGQGFAPAGQIPEKCFDCLCEAASECDEAAECFNKGPGQYLCGPYHISYEYWKDSGKPGENPDDPLDFEKCLNSRPCAEAAIKGYMQKWGNDCDGDMKIDCFDWARIHKGGPRSCNDTWILNTDFWARFSHCFTI